MNWQRTVMMKGEREGRENGRKESNQEEEGAQPMRQRPYPPQIYDAHKLYAGNDVHSKDGLFLLPEKIKSYQCNL